MAAGHVSENALYMSTAVSHDTFEVAMQRIVLAGMNIYDVQSFKLRK